MARPLAIDQMKLLLVFCFLGCCFCSSLINYNFDAILDEFKRKLSVGEDITPLLERFNEETRALETETSVSILKKSVAAKDEIIKLLMQSGSISFNTPAMQTFQDNLIKDLKSHDRLFSTENLESIVGFLVKASPSTEISEYVSVVSKMVRKLTPDQAVRLIQTREFTRLTSNLAGSKSSDTMELSTQDDQLATYSLIMEIFNSNKPVDIAFLRSLMGKLMNLNMTEHPEWLEPILSTMKKAIFDLKHDRVICEHAINFIFQESVVSALPESKLLDSYAIIMHATRRAHFAIFTEKLNLIPSEMRGKLQGYHVLIEDISKLYKLIGFVTNLNGKSRELDFNLAFRALAELKQKSRSSGLAKEIVVLEYLNVQNSFSGVDDAFGNENHALHLNAWKLSFMVGALYFDLVDGQRKINTSSNIISGIGYVLQVASKNSSIEYPSDYVQQILPQIDELSEMSLNYIIDSKIPFTIQQLNAITKAFRLNPVQSKGNAFVNRFCAQYISDRPSEPNRFTALERFDLNDGRGVHLSAFLTFLQNYFENPSSAKLNYLREYFTFMKSWKLLSKSEIIFIEAQLRKPNKK